MATLSAPDITQAKRLVVKIGSALLVDRAKGLKGDWLTALCADVAAAKARGSNADSVGPDMAGCLELAKP